MSTLSCFALVAVGALYGDNQTIVDEIRRVLDLKGTTFPYSAEYDLTMPPQPRIAGGTEKRRFFAEGANHLYSEETTESQRLRVLVRAKTILFAYSDTASGLALFKGAVNLDGESPEHWLDNHSFLFNSYARLDADLIEVIRDLVSGARMTSHEHAGGVHKYQLSGSRIGDLSIVIGAKSVEIKTTGSPGPPPTKAGMIFRYDYSEGRPRWSASSEAELTEDFSKPKGQTIHQLASDFDMFTSLWTAFPHSGEVRVISSAEMKALAERRGYLLPTAPQAKVIESREFNGGLHLKVEFGGRTYSIGQYPVPIKEDKSLVSSAQGRRKLGDYTVLDIEGNWLYFLKTGVSLIVQDPDYKHLPLTDPNLDRLIGSFKPISGMEKRK